jgi:hypothetical protein
MCWVILLVRFVELHLFQGEGVPHDVLGKTLQILSLTRPHASAAVHVKAGVHPAPQHAGTYGRQELSGNQEGDDSGAEHLLQRRETDLR